MGKLLFKYEDMGFPQKNLQWLDTILSFCNLDMLPVLLYNVKSNLLTTNNAPAHTAQPPKRKE